jgi:hypothetical protein
MTKEMPRQKFKDPIKEKAVNKDVQHFIRALSDKITMNEDTGICKDINEQIDTASASIKKKQQRFGVLFS